MGAIKHESSIRPRGQYQNSPHRLQNQKEISLIFQESVVEYVLESTYLG